MYNAHNAVFDMLYYNIERIYIFFFLRVYKNCIRPVGTCYFY